MQVHKCYLGPQVKVAETEISDQFSAACHSDIDKKLPEQKVSFLQGARVAQLIE